MKWRFFRHLAGWTDPDSERVYRWHIEKRRAANQQVGIGMDAGKQHINEYVTLSRLLVESMEAAGFLPEAAIPIDPDGELLGGAHRTTCALALGIDCYVQHKPQRVWAPPWDRQWFIDNGMSEADLSRTLADWETMRA